jgi:hypothetical protein
MNYNNQQPSDDQSEEMDYGAEHTYVDSRVVKTVRKLRIRYIHVINPYQQCNSKRTGHCLTESIEPSPLTVPEALIRSEKDRGVQGYPSGDGKLK